MIEYSVEQMRELVEKWPEHNRPQLAEALAHAATRIETLERREQQAREIIEFLKQTVVRGWIIEEEDRIEAWLAEKP